MNIKKVADVIIDWIKHPLGFLIFIYVFVKVLIIMYDVYLKETKLERMIYK